MIVFARRYATAAQIEFPMVVRNTADLAATSGWVPATGDAKVSQDGGAFANSTNLPEAIASGAGWKLTLTAAELTCARLAIAIVDRATKAVEDQFLLIETFGNASAQFAHDWSAGYSITPLSSTISDGAVSDTDVTVYESSAVPSLVWTITDSTGAAVNLSGATVQLQVIKRDATSLFTASGSVSGASSNIVTVSHTTANTATPGHYRYELRRTDSGNERVLARGDFIIAAKARE